MRRRVRSSLSRFVPMLVIAGLAACGAQSGAGGNSSAGVRQGAPTATSISPGVPATTATTAATAVSPTGGVSIRLDHSQYATTDAITATIVNGLPSPVTATDHHSSCSLLDLQRKTPDGTWLTVAPCTLAIKTRLVTLAAGSATPQRLAPAPGDQNPPSGDAAWTPGTYRLMLPYSVGPQGSAQAATAYSDVFTVA